MHQARRDSGYAWPLQKAGAATRDFAVEPVMVASDPQLIKDALVAGEGLSLGMHTSMQADVDGERLRRVLPAWSGPNQAFHALYLPGQMVSPKVRAFVDYLREALVE